MSESGNELFQGQAGAPGSDDLGYVEPVEDAGGTSQARIDANRANAQHSTGPRSPQGKARVARNAVKHGLLSRQAVLPTEDFSEFQEFHAAMWLDLKAVGAREEMLAERIIAQYWRLRRVMRVETCLFDRDAGRSLALERTMRLGDVRPAGEPVHPAALGEAIHSTMGAKHNPYEALRRYERTIQRDLDACARQLEELQRTRRDHASREGPGQMPVLPEDSRAAPVGAEPIGFVSQETGAGGAVGWAVSGTTHVSTEDRGNVGCREDASTHGTRPHGAEPVGFVSQKDLAERDITGRQCTAAASREDEPLSLGLGDSPLSPAQGAGFREPRAERVPERRPG